MSAGRSVIFGSLLFATFLFPVPVVLSDLFAIVVNPLSTGLRMFTPPVALVFSETIYVGLPILLLVLATFTALTILCLRRQTSWRTCAPAGRYARTLTASSPPIGGDVQVVAFKWMTMFAKLLRCIQRWRTFASQDICLVSNGFQMLWIDASTVSAQMVNRKPFRNRADKILIRPAMPTNGSAVSTRQGSNVELSVSRNADSGCPLPTPRFGNDVLRLESLVRFDWLDWHSAPSRLIQLQLTNVTTLEAQYVR